MDALHQVGRRRTRTSCSASWECQRHILRQDATGLRRSPSGLMTSPLPCTMTTPGASVACRIRLGLREHPVNQPTNHGGPTGAAPIQRACDTEHCELFECNISRSSRRGGIDRWCHEHPDSDDVTIAIAATPGDQQNRVPGGAHGTVFLVRIAPSTTTSAPPDPLDGHHQRWASSERRGEGQRHNLRGSFMSR